MRGFQSEQCSRRARLMHAVFCEDVTVAVGKLSAHVHQSSFPGSSQDWWGTPGLRSHEEETEKQPESDTGVLKETLGLRGDYL